MRIDDDDDVEQCVEGDMSGDGECGQQQEGIDRIETAMMRCIVNLPVQAVRKSRQHRDRGWRIGACVVYGLHQKGSHAVQVLRKPDHGCHQSVLVGCVL